jgi:hypothetical protein
MVTNVVSRLAGGSSYVVESGPLQQILNYGILGCLLFYAMLMQVVKTVPTRYIWLKAAAASLVLNSLVYQSIEVFPVIVLLGLLPWLADMLDARPRVSAATPQPLPIHP